MKISNNKELQLKYMGSHHSSDIDFKNFIQLSKDYTQNPYSFLVNDTTFSIHYNLAGTYYKNEYYPKNKISLKQMLTVKNLSLPRTNK